MLRKTKGLIERLVESDCYRLITLSAKVCGISTPPQIQSNCSSLILKGHTDQIHRKKSMPGPYASNHKIERNIEKNLFILKLREVWRKKLIVISHSGKVEEVRSKPSFARAT